MDGIESRRLIIHFDKDIFVFYCRKYETIGTIKTKLLKVIGRRKNHLSMEFCDLIFTSINNGETKEETLVSEVINNCGTSDVYASLIQNEANLQGKLGNSELEHNHQPKLEESVDTDE